MQKLTLSQLEKMGTKRLLYYKRHVNRQVFGIYEDMDFSDCNCEDCTASRERRKEWRPVYKNIKKVLATREHVEKRGPNEKQQTKRSVSIRQRLHKRA